MRSSPESDISVPKAAAEAALGVVVPLYLKFTLDLFRPALFRQVLLNEAYGLVGVGLHLLNVSPEAKMPSQFSLYAPKLSQLAQMFMMIVSIVLCGFDYC